MHHRSLSRSRALALAACALLLFLTAMVPGWDAAAQSGRQPGKKAPEKKTDTQPAPGKGTNPGKPEDQENAPIPKGLQDEPPLKLSTQVV
ncbi:MAG TPA: hypothetical protein VFV34_17860, partial [Blastocatellia bacterium]|nr:hypothetical protein [Blastocatellia bacterium]